MDQVGFGQKSLFKIMQPVTKLTVQNYKFRATKLHPIYY